MKTISILTLVSLLTPCQLLAQESNNLLAKHQGIAQVRNYDEAQSKAFFRLPVAWQASDYDRENARKAWEILSAFHQGKDSSPRKLHVVYVTFQDRLALPDVGVRYDAMLKNMQAYYADQMQANGFPPLTFPLELDDKGQLIVHEAHVDKPMSEMTVQSSGPVSYAAAKEALAQKGINADANHVLIVCQLPDGVGPYYGGGTPLSGRAWTCDQEHLAPADFVNTDTTPYGRFNKTRSQNATIYIGGTTHELGHAFTLPHTKRGPDYPRSIGRSLMGDGNFSYAEDLRNQGKGSYLSPTDALMLASIPIFCGYDHAILGGNPRHARINLESLQIEGTGANKVKIQGKVTAKAPVYGVVSHLDPPGGSDYDANARGTVPEPDGSFCVEVERPHHRGLIELRLRILLANGTSSQISAPLIFSAQGVQIPPFGHLTYLRQLAYFWMSGNSDRAHEILTKLKQQNANDTAILEELVPWEAAIVRMTKPMDFKHESPALAASDANLQELSLADCKPDDVQVGYSRPSWDAMPPRPMGPSPVIGGIDVKRFVVIHAPGKLIYSLGAAWSQFHFTLGMPFFHGGSVACKVLSDGKEIYSSPVTKENEFQTKSLNVQGVQSLEIQFTDGGDGNTQDWAVFANPTLAK